MFHLILSACLAAQPQICEPRLLPAGEALIREDCEMRAAPIASDWLARHHDLTGGKARCVATEDLATEMAALEVTEIAPGLYVHLGAMAQLSPQNRGRIANLSFVIGRDTVAVIDAIQEEMASVGRWLADRHGFAYPDELEDVVRRIWNENKESLSKR